MREHGGLESGARWRVNGGIGSPSDEGPEAAAGISILTGGDLPDHNRLIGFGVSRTIGDEPGFAVELDIDRGRTAPGAVLDDGGHQSATWSVPC